MIFAASDRGCVESLERRRRQHTDLQILYISMSIIAHGEAVRVYASRALECTGWSDQVQILQRLQNRDSWGQTNRLSELNHDGKFPTSHFQYPDRRKVE